MIKESFDTIEQALEDIANGKMIIVVDDEDRENEGDLVMAAHFATPDSINFMIKHGRGLVCMPLTEQTLAHLKLEELGDLNKDRYSTAFTASIDAVARYGVTTGISASDRARTIQTCINPLSCHDDFVSPGHVFPLKAREMGVLRRAGHTEAAVDFARLAGLHPSGVICEIIKEDGEMARVPDLMIFAKKHRLSIVTIKDLIRYRLCQERFIVKGSSVNLPTKYGIFRAVTYGDKINKETHLVLIKGDINNEKTVLSRIHSECLTGDVFHSMRCDCGEQLAISMEMIAERGVGLILYMRQEGRGIGLANKLKAYHLQDEGDDTVEANLKLGFSPDLRDYGVGAQILLDLGVNTLSLITNNPRKMVGLEGYGISIMERVPIIVPKNEYNELYLKTKEIKLGHILND